MDLGDVRRTLEIDDARIRAAATFHQNLAIAYTPGDDDNSGPFAEITRRGADWERHGRIATEYRLAAEWWALVDPHQALSTLWLAGAHYLATGASDAHSFGVYVLACSLPFGSQAHEQASIELEQALREVRSGTIDHPVQATYLELAAIGMGFTDDLQTLDSWLERHGRVRLGPSGIDRRTIRRWLLEPSLDDPELFRRSRDWGDVIAETRSAQALWARLLPRQSPVDLDEVIPLTHTLRSLIGRPTADTISGRAISVDSFVATLDRRAEREEFDPGLAAVNVVVAAALAEASSDGEWQNPDLPKVAAPGVPFVPFLPHR